MKMHVLRPLFVILILVGLILMVRYIIVPKGFGTHERGYMYGWYDKANEERWKSFRIKYKGPEYCKDCHTENYKQIITSIPPLSIES